MTYMIHTTEITRTGKTIRKWVRDYLFPTLVATYATRDEAERAAWRISQGRPRFTTTIVAA